MQIIEITNVTGSSPYDIVICDSTYTYCYTVETGLPSIPPSIDVDLPEELLGVSQLIIKITDSDGCEEFKYLSCPPTPTPTPTITLTPTITPTNATCICLIFTNPTESSLNYGFVNCQGVTINFTIDPLTTIYQCGKNPTYDEGILLTIGTYCVSNVCPPPTPTPTQSITPTPTIPGIIGSFVSCCNPEIEFKVSGIPNYLYPLSGVYYLVSSGFTGCVTSIPSTTSSNIYTCTLIGSQPSCEFCDISHPNVSCD